MLTRNHRGEIVRSTRRINTQIQAELLVGDGWEGIAHAELKRLALIIGAYHSQLENKPGHAETRQAADALKAAYIALDAAYASDVEYESGVNPMGGLELRVRPS